MSKRCRRLDCPLQDVQTGLVPRSDKICALREQRIATYHLYPCGTVLLQQGETGEFLHFLRRGSVKFSVTTGDGQEQILGLGDSGHILGMEALNDAVASSTVTALTEVLVCQIPIGQAKQILMRNPSVLMRLVAYLNQELALAGNMIRNFGVLNAQERVVWFILSLIPANWQPDSGIPLPLPRKDIAQMLGLRAETFSRQLGRIKRLGLLREQDHNFFVTDPDRLKMLVEPSAAHEKN